MSIEMEVTRTRLERLMRERESKRESHEAVLKMAEDEARQLDETEQEQIKTFRTQVNELDVEIDQLASDLETERGRVKGSERASALVRVRENDREPQAVTPEPKQGPVYRTFAQYARDQIITKYDVIANRVAGADMAPRERERAMERLERTIQNTTTSEIAGLLPPTHMAEIMDIINDARPVVASARQVPLNQGKLTFPKIKQRPVVALQSSEKTQAGSLNMQIDLADMTADTYLGAGDLSWQAINWSTPNALELWFRLAAEAYARATETAACTTLESAAGGTVSPALGTAGTEDFAAWSAAVLKGLATIDTNTGSRAVTDTLYVSNARFYQIAGLTSANVLTLAAVGGVDVGAKTGNFRGLRVVGSYGFTNANTAILGDASAFLCAETPGAAVELRAVEPAIGGMEVGVIGAFASTVFDSNRFIHLT